MTLGTSSLDREPRRLEQRQFAFALMAIAGWCDASGFMLFAHLYVSFMSGDATQLGLTLGEGDSISAVKYFSAQALFVCGAVLGRYYRLSRPDHGRRYMLAANVVLLGSTALSGSHALGVPAFICAIIAMGLQNSIMTQEAGVPVGTMVTGALARLGLSIADRIHGKSSDIGDNFGQWFFFVVGALGGAIGFKLLAAGSFWVPSIASAFLIVFAARLPRMIENPQGRLS